MERSVVIIIITCSFILATLILAEEHAMKMVRRNKHLEGSCELLRAADLTSIFPSFYCTNLLCQHYKQENTGDRHYNSEETLQSEKIDFNFVQRLTLTQTK